MLTWPRYLVSARSLRTCTEPLSTDTPHTARMALTRHTELSHMIRSARRGVRPALRPAQRPYTLLSTTSPTRF